MVIILLINQESTIRHFTTYYPFFLSKQKEENKIKIRGGLNGDNFDRYRNKLFIGMSILQLLSPFFLIVFVTPNPLVTLICSSPGIVVKKVNLLEMSCN